MESSSSVADLSALQKVDHDSAATPQFSINSPVRCKKRTISASFKEDKGVLEIDLGGLNLNKSQVKQVVKFVTELTDRGSTTKTEKVHEVVQKYVNSGTCIDIGVEELRRVIPKLMSACYPDHCGKGSKKVKGKWEHKPADWPETVPFLDPSNKAKTDGRHGPKPTKDILEKMFVYLVTKYQQLSSVNDEAMAEVTENSNEVDAAVVVEASLEENSVTSVSDCGDKPTEESSAPLNLLPDDPEKSINVSEVMGMAVTVSSETATVSDSGVCLSSSFTVKEPEDLGCIISAMRLSIDANIASLKKTSNCADGDLNLLSDAAACLSTMGGEQSLLWEKTMLVQGAVDYAKDHVYLSEQWIQRLFELQGKSMEDQYTSENGGLFGMDYNCEADYRPVMTTQQNFNSEFVRVANAGPFMPSRFLMPDPKAMLMPSSVHGGERIVVSAVAQVSDQMDDPTADDNDIKWIHDQETAFDDTAVVTKDVVAKTELPGTVLSDAGVEAQVDSQPEQVCSLTQVSFNRNTQQNLPAEFSPVTSEATPQNGSKDRNRKDSADQVQKSVDNMEISPAAKRPAPIPLMVENASSDDEDFQGPAEKKWKPPDKPELS